MKRVTIISVVLLFLMAVAFVLWRKSILGKNQPAYIEFERLKHGRDRLPVYVVQVFPTGRVIYEGKEFVAVQGRQEGQVDPMKAQALFAKLDGLDFLNIDFSAITTPSRPGAQDSRLTYVNGEKKATMRNLGDFNEGLAEQPRKLAEALMAVRYEINLLLNAAIKTWVGS